MVRIEWSTKASQDISQIYNFIARDSIHHAERQVSKIVNRIDILLQFPNIGRVVAEFHNKNIQELIEGNYRIVYKLNLPNEINILAIHHGARILRKLD